MSSQSDKTHAVLAATAKHFLEADKKNIAGSDSQPAASLEFKEHVVRRDNDRPFSFAGVALAKATTRAGVVSEQVTAALYQTKGGKFICSLSKDDSPFHALAEAVVDDFIASPSKRSGYAKAAVFDTLEEAVGWFRPGRLTDKLREQLGLDKPIRIE